ncbi:MAG: SRPBCC domain-containing protein [Flavobacteriales bacterium]|nr:SRPBCC domain-containing protein [Flavobacteriales bacterium]
MATRRSSAPAKRAKTKTTKTAGVAKVKVTPKGAREFVITRSFNAPRELVFDALSKPPMVKKWLNGPPGWSMVTCKIDLRVGGKFHYVWSNSSGKDMGMGISGVYKEVSRPERIVNTEKFEPAWYPGEALSTTVLSEKNGITLMTITARYDSRKTRDEILASPMEGGLEFSYQELDALLATKSAKEPKKTKQGNALFTGVSEPETVDAYMKKLKHPLKPVAEHLRKVILGADKSIGEGIYWNAPCFYFTGKMKPFDPKTYKRYIVGFNFFKQDMLRLIFLRGAEVQKKGGLLTGDYTDGRRIALFGSMTDVKKHEKEIKRIVKELVKNM